MESTGPPPAAAPFSIVAGGPFYRLCVGWGLIRPPYESLIRLAAVLVLLSWLPPFLLIAAERGLLGIKQFLIDSEAQTRMLICLPILVYTESLVHNRIRRVPFLFEHLDLIPPQETRKFHSAVAGVAKLRDGPIELLAPILIYALRIFLWKFPLELAPGRWYVEQSSAGWRLDAAGWYYVMASVPIYQFLLVRWVFRLAIWTRFLWQVRGLGLHIVPAHPDKSGGLGFLSVAVTGFEPLLFSQSILLATILAKRTKWPFEQEISTIFILACIIILGPLTFFTAKLASARRRGRRMYSLLFSRSVRDFDRRWVGATMGGELPPNEVLQGQGSLGPMYEPVDKMRLAPFGFESVFRLAVWTVLPWMPIALLAGHGFEFITDLLKMFL
jgi:hypothetical protein